MDFKMHIKRLNTEIKKLFFITLNELISVKYAVVTRWRSLGPI